MKEKDLIKHLLEMHEKLKKAHQDNQIVVLPWDKRKEDIKWFHQIHRN